MNGPEKLKCQITDINKSLMGKTFYDEELDIKTTVVVAELDSSDLHFKGKGVALIVVRTLDEGTHDEDGGSISLEACQRDFNLRRNPNVCAIYDPSDFNISNMTIPFTGSTSTASKTKRNAALPSPSIDVTTFKQQRRTRSSSSTASTTSGSK